jgi:ABC-2 type transport system ATP-binding protein
MGHDSVAQSVKVRREVGWMPADQRALLMRHSVRDNLRFHGQLQGMSKLELESGIGSILEIVGLSDWASSTCFALSSGMKARLQLARALLHEPQVLILDEPTGAVDPVASHELVNLIRDIVSQRQIAALISSHKIDEIQSLGSRVLMMDKGKLRYDGSLEALKNKYASTRLEIRFRNAAEAAQAQQLLLNADIGTVVRIEDVEVACELKTNVTHAAVLDLLKHQTEDILALREAETPLQGILANIYRESGNDQTDI